ncbi:MFS transporter [Actinomycetospora callitridis]|uniref:MFS transporter n=1 Tax=Actinomycetospora callitridis TaxID=913944 RepID=UPI0023671BFE|nr:MFS transporter [Actinomycetospora callitridis]MDD7916341.1 MFS transporter [Actinomycetospora callitridis]
MPPTPDVDVATPGRTSAGVRRGAWTATALAFAFMVLNFADKSVLGFAGSRVMRDLGIGPAEFGLVQSAFFWLFAAGALIVGALSIRVSTRWLMPALMVVWVLTMVPLLTPVSFGVLLACRVVLGFAEGPAYALATHVVHSWFPAEKRALPAGVISAGSSVGPLVAAPVLTWVIVAWSWHAAFGVLIVLGLLWVVAWAVLGRPSPEETAAADAPRKRTDWRLVGRQLATPTILGVGLLTFVGYWTTTLRVSWLPLYLEQGLGYDTTSAGRLVTLPYAVAAVAAIGAGLLSNRMVARGVARRIARGWLSAAFVVTGGACMVLLTVVGPGLAQMVFTVLAFSLNSASYGVALTVVADLVDPAHRGAVLGVLVAIYSMAGVIAPLVLGFAVEGAGGGAAGYGVGFAISGVVIVVGGLLSVPLIDPERDAARLERATA